MGAEHGREKPLSSPSMCQPTNETAAQTDPLNHQQLHLANQSLLGLERRMNSIYHCSAVLACVTQISGWRRKQGAHSHQTSLGFPANARSQWEQPQTLPSFAWAGAAGRTPAGPGFPGRTLPGTLRFPVSGSLLKTRPGEERKEKRGERGEERGCSEPVQRAAGACKVWDGAGTSRYGGTGVGMLGAVGPAAAPADTSSLQRCPRPAPL